MRWRGPCPRGSWASATVAAAGRGGTLWRLLPLALAVLVVVSLWVDQVRRIGDFRVDDAYITFSYSKNIALGHGAIYSHDLRVEGYSNFLWMLLLAIGEFFHIDSMLFARVLSFAFLGVGVAAVYVTVRRRAARWAGMVAVVLLACCSDLVRAALSGLETAAFSASLAVAWAAYLAEHPARRRWSLWAFLPLALLRIDGFVPMVAVIVFEFASALVGRRLRWKRFLLWLLPACSIWMLYFAWRYNYYGLLFPTTYYAKSLVTAYEPLRGWRQLAEVVEDYGAIWLLPLAMVPLLRGPRREALTLLWAIFSQAAYAGKAGGDWMPFWRFVQPVVPLVCMLVGLGFATLVGQPRSFPSWTRARQRLNLSRRMLSALAGVALVTVSARHLHLGWVDSEIERMKIGYAETVKEHTRAMLASMDLAAYVVRKPGQRFVTDYAGVFAVHTKATVIDMFGLANKLIAIHGDTEGIQPMYGKTCTACYELLDPDFFHVYVPLVRTANAFASQQAVLDEVFQSQTIGRYLDFPRDYAAGYVLEHATGRAFWFLERRREGVPLTRRNPAPDIEVVYPFGSGHLGS